MRAGSLAGGLIAALLIGVAIAAPPRSDVTIERGGQALHDQALHDQALHKTGNTMANGQGSSRRRYP
jgi:hypothetical protein